MRNIRVLWPVHKGFHEQHYYLFYVDADIQPVNCTTGDIRLVGGVLENEGRLEVCINQVWGTVCRYSWSSVDSRVACRQLGYHELGIYSVILYFVCHVNLVRSNLLL